MNKSSKLFWVFLSIIFAVGSITIGSIHESNRKKSLNASIEQVTNSSDVAVDTSKKTKSSSDKTKKSEEKETEATTDSSEVTSFSSDTVVESVPGLAAQDLINVIIIEGQVQPNFTLDDYYAAKSAVDALPESGERENLSGQISQIETALTNMGISF